jgi:hypothetical protein
MISFSQIHIYNLSLDNVTALALTLATLFFLGSFVFISRTNDMKGSLLSLLPKRKK